MMLRATVVDVNPRDPTRVWVTIPQKYGTKPLRVFTRVEVTKGDHVYVANTSVTRVPQWVVFGQQTEIGRWGNPYPHTHPIGQVDGLVDWVSQYETWTKDHQARLDAADKQIADGKLVVAQARKDLDQAQTDIADAVRKATVEQARLDQAEANLDQMGRNLLAAGGRISANETALADSQKRIDAAESTVAEATKNLTTLEGTVGDVSTAAATAQATAQDALLIGFGRDVLPPRGPADVSAWAPLTWDPSAPGDTAGTTAGALAAVNGGARSRAVLAAPGEYTWTVSARASAPDTRYYLQLWRYASDGTNITPNPYLVSNRVVPADSWETLSGTVTLPEGTTKVVLQIYALHQNGARPAGAVQWFRGLSLRRLVPGALVVNGSITGDKVDASTVSGALGQFLKVEAASGTFTDSLTGRNARLLGETVAESINITGELRGRDAILSGTVDVGQLNVTGEMSAKIISTATLQARQGFFTEGLTAQDAALLGTTVAENLVVTDAFSARVVNAMTAQTKQLVVTEDAILNKATVIQSLVTPELITQKADIGVLAANMITSGKLQTSTAAARGVKIDNAGVRAWDDTGRQTVNLNGKNNYLVR